MNYVRQWCFAIVFHVTIIMEDAGWHLNLKMINYYHIKAYVLKGVTEILKI